MYREKMARNSTFIVLLVDPGGPVVIILASGSEVRGFDPAGVNGFFS